MLKPNKTRIIILPTPSDKDRLSELGNEIEGYKGDIEDCINEIADIRGWKELAKVCPTCGQNVYPKEK